MTKTVSEQLAELERMTPRLLRERWQELTGEEARSNNKDWLIKRIAWRIQANIEGDLSERARRRAEELANDADLRLKAPATLKMVVEPRSANRQVQTKMAKKTANALPPVGTVLTRDYRGQNVNVQVREAGIEYLGELYPTLSAVAKAITGTHTSGFLFFKLGQYAGGAK